MFWMTVGTGGTSRVIKGKEASAIRGSRYRAAVIFNFLFPPGGALSFSIRSSMRNVRRYGGPAATTTTQKEGKNVKIIPFSIRANRTRVKRTDDDAYMEEASAFRPR